MRLNKFIAEATGLSRRQADEAIQSGKVELNGIQAVLGQPVGDKDTVKYDGEVLRQQEFIYLLVNKPLGYVCSRKQQDDKPTIYSLLPEKYHTLKPAGRIDADSRGLVLLTNDGDFTHQLTHPSFQKTKKYEVKLDHSITDEHRKRIESGLDLEDGISKFGVVQDGDHYVVTMQEGRNRQIRRTFNQLGYEILDLYRTDFGPYRVDGIEEGKTRLVNKLS